jgi:hypothetical protein
MHEDEDNIDTVPEMPSKNQGTCHFYLDPVATYMENFLTVEPQSFSDITFVFQDCRGLCVVNINHVFSKLHFAVLSLWAKGQALLFTVLKAVKQSTGLRSYLIGFIGIFVLFDLTKLSVA